MLEVKGQLNALGVAQQIKASGGGSASQDYSTDEHVVGKWIDGETDVYERTFYYENGLALTYNDWVDTGITAEDGIDRIVCAYGMEITNKGAMSTFELIPGADSYPLGIMLLVNLADRKLEYLTIRYMKALS